MVFPNCILNPLKRSFASKMKTLTKKAPKNRRRRRSETSASETPSESESEGIFFIFDLVRNDNNLPKILGGENIALYVNLI